MEALEVILLTWPSFLTLSVIILAILPTGNVSPANLEELDLVELWERESFFPRDFLAGICLNLILYIFKMKWSVYNIMEISLYIIII